MSCAMLARLALRAPHAGRLTNLAPITAAAPRPTQGPHQPARCVGGEPAHIKAIVDQISQLKFHEINILNEALKRELKIPDVQMAAPGAVAAQSPTEDSEEAASVNKLLTVKLVKFDAGKKVALIKEIKKIVSDINLVEAKKFVEECPRVVKSNLTQEEADALKKQLQDQGATIKVE